MEINDDRRIEALAKITGDAAEDFERARYGDHTFIGPGNAEYLVLTDDEADAAARTAIEDSLWAFRPEFIAAHANATLDAAAIDALGKMQGELCESAGPLVRALIRDFDHFVADAIRADGRGHFLAGYDGKESETYFTHNNAIGGFYLYVYRVN